jgi:hypothetical protein
MARTILIGYDLNKPEQVYEPLIDEIKAQTLDLRTNRRIFGPTTS